MERFHCIIIYMGSKGVRLWEVPLYHHIHGFQGCPLTRGSTVSSYTWVPRVSAYGRFHCIIIHKVPRVSAYGRLHCIIIYKVPRVSAYYGRLHCIIIYKVPRVL